MFSATARKPDGTILVVFGLDDNEAERMLGREACCFKGTYINMPTFGFVFMAEFPGEGYEIPLMECEDQLAFSFSERQLRQHGMLAEIPVEDSGLTVFIFRGESTESMARDHASLIGPTTVVKDPFGIAPFRKN